MTLDEYLENRRRWEILIAAGLLVVSLAANISVVWMELERAGIPFSPWLPVVLEVTSHAGLALLIPVVLWFDHRFPIRAETLRTSLAAHAAFSVVFSLLHVGLMYWTRVAAFALLVGGRYRWDNWLWEFGYEYLKDFRTYMLLLALIYLYRFVLRRLRGEAGFVAEGEDDAGKSSERFLVKKLGREFLVRTNDIDWIEAAGNYVNLHVGRRVYPLRETMNNIGERLLPHGFQRVHRSAIVNLDRVAAIDVFDTGDGEARLESEAVIPVSRRFRKELRQRLG